VGMDQNATDEDLDNMIRDGYVRASCPKCSATLESITLTKCPICNKEIDSGSILINLIDWSKAN
jgi:uncharacterized protein (UPF0212 family)